MSELLSQTNSPQQQMFFQANAMTHAIVHHFDTGTNPAIHEALDCMYVCLIGLWKLCMHVHTQTHNQNFWKVDSFSITLIEAQSKYLAQSHNSQVH